MPDGKPSAGTSQPPQEDAIADRRRQAGYRQAAGLDGGGELGGALGEGAGDFLVVNHRCGRAGELLVEVEAGVLPGSFRQHELIDSLDAGELRRVSTAPDYQYRPSLEN